MTPETFRRALSRICAQETSFDPGRWTPENPLWGHCAVASLLANDFFGGTFLRAFLDGTPFADVGSHYWNVFPDGTEVDFTQYQFGSIALCLKGEATRSDGSLIDREYLLKNPETKRRYELLAKRLKEYLQSPKTS